MMTFIEGPWRRLPIAVRAVLTGVSAAAAGILPWAWLVSSNIRHQSALPWSVPIMAAYLWLYWRYVVRGWGWPRATAETRRMDSRVNRLPGDVWGAALLAGMLGLVSVLLLQGVLSRLVLLPRQRDIDPMQYPGVTVLLWVVMSAVVAGVVEEVSFRGYLQRPIERRHGPVIAVLVAGTLFGLVHFAHPEVGLVLLPFYVAVASVYGALAYFTDSTLPSMVLHAGGNMFSAFDLFARGRSEWQLSAVPRPLIWETGPDVAFWGNLAALLLVSALAVWAYSALAAAARAARAASAAYQAAAAVALGSIDPVSCTDEACLFTRLRPGRRRPVRVGVGTTEDLALPSIVASGRAPSAEVAVATALSIAGDPHGVAAAGIDAPLFYAPAGVRNVDNLVRRAMHARGRRPRAVPFSSSTHCAARCSFKG